MAAHNNPEDNRVAFFTVVNAVKYYMQNGPKGATLKLVQGYFDAYMNPPMPHYSRFYVQNALRRGMVLGIFKCKGGKYIISQAPSLKPPPVSPEGPKKNRRRGGRDKAGPSNQLTKDAGMFDQSEDMEE